MFSFTVSAENSAPCWKSTPSRMSSLQPLGFARLVDVDAEQLDRARTLLGEAEDGPHQHRLAGARGADEAQDLAALDVERQFVEDDIVAEADGDVARRKHDVASPRGAALSVRVELGFVRSSPSRNRSPRRIWRTCRRG